VGKLFLKKDKKRPALVSRFTSPAWTRPNRHFRHGDWVAVETWDSKSRVKNHKPKAHNVEAGWGTCARLIPCKVDGNQKQSAKKPHQAIK
jgi:hypothetical protein